jgi:hypothetical protein
MRISLARVCSDIKFPSIALTKGIIFGADNSDCGIVLDFIAPNSYAIKVWGDEVLATRKSISVKETPSSNAKLGNLSDIRNA